MESNIKNLNELKGSNYIAYPYRWIVLIIFMFIGAMTQIIWITFAAITSESATYYSVSKIKILLLSVIFMIVYIPMNFPACWFIDKFGLKWGTGIGVILTGVFGFLRAVFPNPNYGWIMFCQIMTAVGQPFVLNSFTKLASSWFPEKEKALASGFGTMALLLGVIIAFLTTPYILGSTAPYHMNWVLYIFGSAALLSMILYLIFVRDKPPTPPNAYSDESKVLATKGTLSLFKIRDFNYLFVLLFIGLGTFNVISSVLDIIFAYPEGDPRPGLIGGVMIIGGIIGAVVISTLSDKFRKRRLFIIIAMFAGAILTPLLYFYTNDISRYITSFLYGFMMVSALPVGLTYAAEITHPIPPETSNGLMMWAGQIGGIILLACVMITQMYNINLMSINIIIMTILLIIGILFSFFMRELDAYKK